MSSTDNKSYNTIVKTCKLVDYRCELAADQEIWSEYWQDSHKNYRAIFTKNSGWLPHTIFTHDNHSQSSS